jgi:hypothetical protein
MSVVIIYKQTRGVWQADGSIKVGETTYPDRVSYKCHIDRLLEKKRDQRYDVLATSIQRAENKLK